MSTRSLSVRLGADRPPPRRVDALVVGQRAADSYGGADLVALDAIHHQHHAAVVEQQLVAHAAVLHQLWVVNADDAGRARFLGMDARQGEGLAHLQLHQLVGEARDADLRSLQVAHDRDVSALPRGDLAHQARAFAVVVGAAVRSSVEPHPARPGSGPRCARASTSTVPGWRQFWCGAVRAWESYLARNNGNAMVRRDASARVS